VTPSSRPQRRGTKPWSVRSLLVVAALALPSACKGREQPAPTAPPPASQTAAAPATSVSTGPAPSASSAPPVATATPPPETCDAEIARASAESGLGGTPVLDGNRVQIFMAVKGEPTLLVEPPLQAPSDDVAVIAYRRWLSTSEQPGGVLARLVEVLQDRPAEARAVLLRDGYLYAEDLLHADALVRYVRAELLFREPEFWIQRGEQLLHATREPGQRRYSYGDGPLRGRPVSLVLFDRVGVGEVPPPVHRDVRALRYRLGFTRLRVRHLTRTHVVADLQYGDTWVPTLLEAQDARLVRVCEVLPEPTRSAVERARDAAIRRSRAVRAVQRAIVLQLDDALPFDEPRDEIGQEDGKLREPWKRAYERGRLTFEHRTQRYPVFGPRGAPLVPEVCVDFLLDALERAAGTWWRPRGEPRERVVGRLDFDAFDRERLRRVPEFSEFVRAHPEWFEPLEIPESSRIILGHPVDLTQYLMDHVSDFQPGDMLVLGGHVPWDPRPYVHHHSFFVFESDPLTGMPLLLAGNPGRTCLRTWRTEMRRTPLRAIRLRVRPRPEWLEAIVVPEPSEEPPPLALGP
jgi:hypothetical protein